MMVPLMDVEYFDVVPILLNKDGQIWNGYLLAAYIKSKFYGRMEKINENEKIM